MDDECPSNYFEGLSRCVDITRNEDGTFAFTIMQTAGSGAEIEFQFTTIPFLTFHLGTFEEAMHRREEGKEGLKELPFELKLTGYMKPSVDNFYYSWKAVRSPAQRPIPDLTDRSEHGADL